jgi:hypothetical protein
VHRETENLPDPMPLMDGPECQSESYPSVFADAFFDDTDILLDLSIVINPA